jgi:hypothetical protein
LESGTEPPDASSGTPTPTPAPVSLYKKLEDHLSPLRMESYSKNAASPDPERVVLARYLYNLSLCEALYPALHLFEVVLRNAICRAATIRWPGTGSLDPVSGRLDCWLDLEPAASPLLPEAQKMVAETTRKLAEAKYIPSEGRLIAALPFGFWTGMLSSHYGDPMPSKPRLWPSLLLEAFPHLPEGARSRSLIADRIHYIRQLRNRVFHHEPIWRRKLRRDEDSICKLITFISPEAERVVRASSRLSEVVKASLVPHERRVRELAELSVSI